ELLHSAKEPSEMPFFGQSQAAPVRPKGVRSIGKAFRPPEKRVVSLNRGGGGRAKAVADSSSGLHRARTGGTGALNPRKDIERRPVRRPSRCEIDGFESDRVGTSGFHFVPPSFSKVS